ncbi:MerR family transcriptional regulator [Micromonospora sonneratiae]
MNIGEFAELTGLGVKALRLYDERGLLVPAAVDPWSRYRRYTPAQLAPAIRLKALRAAGVSLADAARALDDPREAEVVLAEHRARIAAERQRQDAALAVLQPLLGGDGWRWTVEERRSTAQHWVGVRLPVTDVAANDEGDIEAADERANEGFAALWHALSAEGNAPIGPFWSSFRPGTEEGTTIDLLCCWPVARPVPADWSVPGWTTEVGQVSAGTELVVRWRHDDPIPLVEGATHPAVVALLVEAEARGAAVDLSSLRQIGLFEAGESVGVEVAMALRRS